MLWTTLADAAYAYCEQRMLVASITKRLRAERCVRFAGRTAEELAAVVGSDCITDAYQDEAGGGERSGDWEHALKAVIEEPAGGDWPCPSCRVRAQLIRERYEAKKSLGGLMRAMMAAARRIAGRGLKRCWGEVREMGYDVDGRSRRVAQGED